ncbi:MAG: GNAT family N-acetyltransferase [Candidatus Eisenbacteria bacterium]
MTFKIRPFDKSDEDYRAAVDVSNANWPEELAAPESWQHRDKHRDEKYLFGRVVGEVDGKVAAYSSYGESSWAHVAGKYFIHIEVHPDHQRNGYGAAIYDHVTGLLAERDPLFFTADTREDKPDFIRFLTKHGFEQTMRYPVSHLNPQTFDFSKFDGVEGRVKEHGIEIVNVPDLPARDPDWKRNWYELEQECWMDVPLPEPPTRGSYEEFESRFDSPNYDARAHFIAIDGDRYVGMTGFWTSPVEKHKLYTGLTGVIRSHRRKGIATALKVSGARYARDYGATIVETDNEENNPMFGLNMQLGFEAQPAWIDFRKVLREPREGETIPEVKER